MFPPFSTPKPTVPVIRLAGVIAAGRAGTLSDAAIGPLIERAFAMRRARAVALAVNSPGGSPVQSALIAARIRRLAAEKGLKVYAFCEDLAASGGYWLACAADEIYADASSIVGSIGVISAGFGFQDFIGRYGIERRVHTAGEDKSFLDPFRAERPEDIAHLKDLQADIHARFIDHVRARRGDRLTGPEGLFSGRVFTGTGAVAAGLIDGLEHLKPKMQAMFGKDVRLPVLSARRGLFRRLGLPGAEDVLAAAEDRLAWARYGL